MDNLLQSLHELEGVNGALVVDGAGQLLGYRAHTVYDAELLQRVGKFVIGAVDSVKLIQEDWNAITAQFAEGKLLIRNLGDGEASTGSTVVLAVIADSRLNMSFAGVAVRVAVAKLKALLDGNPNVSLSTGSYSTSQGTPATRSPFQGHTTVSPTASSMSGGSNMGGTGRPSTSNVATSGLSWSGLSGTSTMSGSNVTVADAASSEFLTVCTKVLARIVGPMAKLYVKEAARKVSPEKPFSRDRADELLTELSLHISNPAEAAQFRAQVYKGL